MAQKVKIPKTKLQQNLQTKPSSSAVTQQKQTMQELSVILRQGFRKIFDKLLLHDRLMMTVGSWSSAREGLKQKQNP